MEKLLTRYCGVQLSMADFTLLLNGESDVEIMDSVRGKNVYIVQSSGRDTNNHLMGLLLFVQACKLAGARRITAVLPLLPYARGDHKEPEKRKPIPTKIIAGMLETAGTSQVITVDIHSPQTEAFFTIPVDCLTARFLFERWVKENVPRWDKAVICSPDEGGTRRAGSFAERLRLPMALIHRDRNGGASTIYILVTHAVFSQVPDSLFDQPEVKKVVVTNTVSNELTSIRNSHVYIYSILLVAPPLDFRENEKISIIDVSDVIGEAIRRNHYGESVRAML